MQQYKRRLRKYQFGGYEDPKKQQFNKTAGNYTQVAGAVGSGLSADSGNEVTGLEQGFRAAGNSIPIWGPLTSLATGVSDKIRGDGTNAGKNVGSELFHPSQNLFNAIDSGDPLEALPIVGSIRAAKRRKKEERDKMDAADSAALDRVYKTSEGILSTYPSFGVMEAAYGMKIPKYPAGGKLPYPVDGSEVEQLASDTAVYNGETHENGGIELDTNQDGSPEIEVENEEVIKDDMVFSDRLNPSDNIKSLLKGMKVSFKDKDTYASLSEKLARKKGKYEEKLSSTRIGEAGTAKLMTERYDNILNNLFQDQQDMKAQNNIGEYEFGGLYKKKRLIQPRAFGGVTNGEDDPTKKKKAATKTDEYTEETALVPENIIFKNEQEYNSYMLKRSLERMSPENRKLYSDAVEGNITNLTPQDIISKYGPYEPYKLYMRGKAKPDPMGNVLGRAYGVMAYGGDIELNKKARLIKPRADYGGYLPVVVGKKKGYIVGNDFMPKYPHGGYHDSPTGSYLEDEEIREDGFADLNQTPRRTFGERFEDNFGNIVSGVGFIANQAQINKLETQYKPTLAQNPVYNFNSRLPYLSSQIKSAYRTASEGIKGSGAQDNQALRSNLFAKTLNTLNQATSDEFAREDQFRARHSENVSRIGLYNTGALNDANYRSMDNRNQKRALTQQNIDALLRGIQGNKFVKDQKALETFKTKLQLAKAGNRGVDKRFIDDLDPEERRIYYQLVGKKGTEEKD
jgi:hypothetical protein